MARSRLFGAAAMLAAIAAGGWRAVRWVVPSDPVPSAYHSTSQSSDARYQKHPPGTVAQSKRDATKKRNRARHRLACRRAS
jgi:hypothetical protein